jgi:Acyltransferase family
MSVTALVLARSVGRDRVQDAVKAAALGLVLLGHLLAWTVTSDGSVVNTLERANQMAPFTWVLQILPLFFFLAGANMVASLARSTDLAGWYRARVVRLLAGTLPLLALAAALSGVLLLVKPDASRSGGLLPVQLVWFLAVYAVLTAAGPLLAAWQAWWAPVLWLAVVAGVDLLRIQVGEDIGWINLVLVWGLFALVGTHLPRLREVPRWIPALVGVAFAAAAAVLVWRGPYSVALITTTAAPGLSNLAPPSLVMACAGVAQIGFLLAVWPALDGLLSRDRVWVPVAVFATRAMQIYLWHMLFVTLCVGLVLATGLRADALSLWWWVQHLVVAGCAVGSVWFASPWLGRLTAAIIGRLASAPSVRLRGVAPAAGCLVLGGLTLLLVSDSGMGDPLTFRTVLGALPFQPLAALLVLCLLVAVCTERSSP